MCTLCFTTAHYDLCLFVFAPVHTLMPVLLHHMSVPLPSPTKSTAKYLFCMSASLALPPTITLSPLPRDTVSVPGHALRHPLHDDGGHGGVHDTEPAVHRHRPVCAPPSCSATSPESLIGWPSFWWRSSGRPTRHSWVQLPVIYNPGRCLHNGAFKEWVDNWLASSQYGYIFWMNAL